MTTSISRRLLCLALLALLSLPTLAQTEDHQQETIRIKTDLVTLDALVTDKKTREIIRNLTIQDFELFEDDAKQQIEHFSQDKLPLSVVLLLDISPSVHPVIEEIQKGALQALGHLKPEDEVALMVFAGVAELIQDFTKDRKVIADKVGLALTRDGHGTRIHEAIGKLNPDDEVALMAFGAGAAVIQDFTTDRKLITLKLRNFAEEARKQNLGAYQNRTGAVFQAAEHMDKAANPLSRRVIVVVTDDAKSMYEAGKSELVAERVLGAGCSVYALVANGYSAGKGKVKRAVVESAIYSFGNPFSFVIGLGSRLAAEAVLNAILSDKNFNRIVAKSGGTAARADGDATSEKLASLLDFLRNRYVVGFTPPQHTAAERFHKLSLKITPLAKKREGEVAVVTAQGYFARRNDQSGAQSAANDEKK